MFTEFLMQPDPTAGAPTSGAAPAASSAGSLTSMMLPIALMFGVFYFLLFRPQQKRQRETDDLLKALKKGDVVRTSGGVRGEITDITDTEVTLLIADKVKINVLRSHVATKVAPDAKDKV